jgi:hypothetical protein
VAVGDRLPQAVPGRLNVASPLPTPSARVCGTPYDQSTLLLVAAAGSEADTRSAQASKRERDGTERKEDGTG